MNQYTQEQSILYLTKLNRRAVAYTAYTDEGRRPRRRLYVTGRIIRWLVTALPQHAGDTHRQRNEA